MHRGDGYCLQQKKRGSGCQRVPKRLAFKIRWGYRYTHFFYTVDPRPPYSILALSSEWCIASVQDPSDCESIQFAGGLSLRDATDSSSTEIVLSYGVNDCEAKLAILKLDRVWRMLRPRTGQGAVCVPPSGFD